MHTKVSQLLARLGRMFPGVSASVAPLGIVGRIMSHGPGMWPRTSPHVGSDRSGYDQRGVGPDLQAREIAGPMMVRPRPLAHGPCGWPTNCQGRPRGSYVANCGRRTTLRPHAGPLRLALWLAD